MLSQCSGVWVGRVGENTRHTRNGCQLDIVVFDSGVLLVAAGEHMRWRVMAMVFSEDQPDCEVDDLLTISSLKGV